MTVPKSYLFPVFGVALLVLVGCSSAAPSEIPTPVASAAESSWSYEEDWGKIAPTCAVGPNSKQSPIDIDTTSLIAAPSSTFDVAYKPTLFSLENNGHTIEATPEDLTANSVMVGEVMYYLQQFHFHASSEHLIDGASFAAELHLVHKSKDGAKLVLGVLLRVGEENQELRVVVVTV